MDKKDDVSFLDLKKNGNCWQISVLLEEYNTSGHIVVEREKKSTSEW